MANAYGVQMNGMPLAIPSVFVIGQDRTIHWKHVGETVPDRPTADAVLEVVDGMRSA